MAYMFVHDGLVHRRFPVGPIANVPYLRKVAAAHQVYIFSSLIYINNNSFILSFYKHILFMKSCNTLYFNFDI